MAHQALMPVERHLNSSVRNGHNIRELLMYGNAILIMLSSFLITAALSVRYMYTTNAVESINSSFRKVTKKGAFPSENALLKLLYLRITELYKKWNGSSVQNWAMVRNQLITDDKIKTRIEKYKHLI